MSGRISMQDVAAAAGVSVSTVSLALGGDRRVSAGTAERVRAAAESLGYIRDPIIASLAASRFKSHGKPGLIAVAVRREAGLPSLRQAAEAYGYAIRDLSGIRPERFAGACTDIGACAVILGARSRELPRAVPRGLPVVNWLHEGDIPAGQHVIELADWSLLLALTRIRVEQSGFRRPGVVLLPAEPPHWADGVRLGAGLASGLPMLVWQARKTEDLLAWTRAGGFDCLIVQHPLIWKRLRDEGLRIPCAAMSLFAAADPRLAGFMPDLALRNRMTIEMIDVVRRHGPRPTIRTILPSVWHQGVSLRTGERSTD